MLRARAKKNKEFLSAAAKRQIREKAHHFDWFVKYPVLVSLAAIVHPSSNVTIFAEVVGLVLLVFVVCAPTTFGLSSRRHRVRKLLNDPALTSAARAIHKVAMTVFSCALWLGWRYGLGVPLAFVIATGAALSVDGFTATDVVERNQYMLAASYAINDLYFAGTFVDGEDQVKGSSSTTDKTGYELAAAYTMGQTVFTTSYNYLENKTGSTKEDAADNIAIDATYYFKPNFRGYVSYNFNLLDDDKSYISKADAEDELALGLRYDF